jgi:hypothetical protein
MSEWKPIGVGIAEASRHYHKVLYLDATGGVHLLNFYDSDPPGVALTHYLPLPPLPEPKLTVKEALREALCQLESIHKMCRKHDGGGYYIESFYMDSAASILPRLRAALEAE